MAKRLPAVLLSAVPIGMGHLRAASPIDQATHGKIIVASLIGSPKEKLLWLKLRNRYEFLSRLSYRYFFSSVALRILDKIQEIPPLEKGKDLSSPTLQVMILEELIDHGLGWEVVARARRSNLPFVTTFYALAIAADKAGVKKVICIIPDVQVNRAWVALQPGKSEITYAVPLDQTKKRLMAYGVHPDKIHVTGFPLPPDNIKNAKQDFQRRMEKLDQKTSLYGKPINITFAVGGAGAQTHLAIKILTVLMQKITKGQIIYHLSCGIRPAVEAYFVRKLNDLDRGLLAKKQVRILAEKSFADYYSGFNKLLRATDILITKPSELSFYTALGLPMVLAPCIGPHEQYNRAWLTSIGAGIDWRQAIYNFDDYLITGKFAQAARSGYDKACRQGTKNICRLIAGY